MKRYLSVEEYLADQSAEAREKLLELKECILKAVPDAEELFNYNILAYALVPGGKREKQVMMAGYARHVGFYPHPTVIEEFFDELKGYKQGKGSVQFPVDKPLPKDMVIRMVRYRKKLIDKN